MRLWQVRNNRPGTRGMSPAPTRTSKALAAADITTAIGALLAIAAGLGWLTPDELEAAKGGLAELATLAERAFAGVLALAASIATVVRFVRMKLEEIRS